MAPIAARAAFWLPAALVCLAATASAQTRPVVPLVVFATDLTDSTNSSDNSAASAPGVAQGPSATPGYKWHPPPSPPLYLATYEQSYTFWSLLWGFGINAAVGILCLLLFGWFRVSSVYGSKLFRPRQLLMARRPAPPERPPPVPHENNMTRPSAPRPSQEMQLREREREQQAGRPQSTVDRLRELYGEHPKKATLPPNHPQPPPRRWLLLHGPAPHP